MAGPQQLHVFLDGVPIGEVSRTPHGALSFTYDEEYRTTSDATPLSLSMPLMADTHSNRVVSAYLDGLLPDSDTARERWAQQYGANPRNPFSLLHHVGRDAAGAVQILPPEEDPSDSATRTGDIEWLSEDDFAQIARELAAHGEAWDPGRFGGRWSLAGAQPKIALFQDPQSLAWGIPHDSTPTNRIIKPALRAYKRHHVNEALCQRAAREAGLLAAGVELIEIAGVQALSSHRYDRTQDADGIWHRIHQEDLCQALSVHPISKYQKDNGPGVAKIGKLLERLSFEDRAVSVERFFKGLVFNVLIGGTDAHAKNYSLVLIGNRAQIGPLYDVASAACYPQPTRLDSAMKIGGHYTFLEITDADWRQVGKQLGVAGDQAITWVEELRQKLPAALKRAAGSLPADVIEEANAMAERISEHVVGTWRPDQVVTSTTASRPTY
ncbi:type II toxin-antitoxin system HipA family toxin [Kineosporia mesophila]|uniref:Type II toxin-antitoxin system HipA family toxin n=1 Tax=Kineosporia mesophila TaxID=566012 RepID=A0ABP7AML5_9ACTN|nr:type II toxin-antitoxin system HipA family toxin [Kineosporia mesophila]MCD5349412.1 type II toxin-antitoxin system HipA family toxin [Kineosporia mesophila]